jgi:tetratricopeptide (TPR) repeat protein
MIPALVGLWLLASAHGAGPGEAPGAARQDSDRGTEFGAPQQGAPAAILARQPGDLPRAEPGVWADFFDDLTPEKVEARVGAAALLEQARAEQAYAQADYTVALEILYALLEAEPDHPPALLVLGTTYFRLRRYGDGIVALERFVEVAPTQVWRTQVLGHCLYSLGYYERARDHYARVLEQLPDSPEAVRGLALAHLRLGDEDRALELLGQVIALEPANWEAQLHLERGEPELARASAERARDLAAHEPRPWFVLKSALYELGRDQEFAAAEARWRELDSLTQRLRAVHARLLYAPHDFDLLLRLADLCRATGDRDGLRAALDRAVNALPPERSRAELYIYALDSMLAIGDSVGAQSAADALARDCGDESRTWQRLENYYATLRDRTRQIEAGERFLRLRGEGR